MHMCVFWFFSSKRTRDMYKLHIMFHNYKIHPSFLWKIPSPQKVDFNLVEKLNLEKNYKTANNKDKICNSNVFRFFQYEHPIFTSFFFKVLNGGSCFPTGLEMPWHRMKMRTLSPHTHIHKSWAGKKMIKNIFIFSKVHFQMLPKGNKIIIIILLYIISPNIPIRCTVKFWTKVEHLHIFYVLWSILF